MNVKIEHGKANVTRLKAELAQAYQEIALLQGFFVIKNQRFGSFLNSDLRVRLSEFLDR